MLQAALRFAKPAVGLLKTQTPRIASAAQWLQNPLNRAAVGGGLGFLSNNEGTLGGRIRGGLTGAAFGAIPMPGQGLATQGLVRAGLPLATAGPIANVAVPALGLAWAGNQRQGSIPNQVANIGGGGINRLTQGGAGWVAHNTITGETVALNPQAALPQGLGGYGPVGPIGTMFDQIDPSGQYTGRRLGRRLDARTTADELNILAPTIRKWAEQAKRDDLMRSLAAKGVSQNIATNAALTQMAAETGARQATQAANQLGSAITGQYTY